MGFFKRLFGICETPPPTNADCWNLSGGKLRFSLIAPRNWRKREERFDLKEKVCPKKCL